jgi:hypothetical protein
LGEKNAMDSTAAELIVAFGWSVWNNLGILTIDP